MTTLYLHLTTHVLSWALTRGKKAVAFEMPCKGLPLTLSAFVVPALQRFLSDNQLSLHHLDAVWITRGPGSLTRLRLQQTIAKALQVAAPQVSLYGIDLIDVWQQHYNMATGTQPYGFCVDLYNGTLLLSVFHQSKNLLRQEVACQDLLALLQKQRVTTLWGEETHLKSVEGSVKDIFLKSITPCAAKMLSLHQKTLQKKIEKIS
ncbi:MAG: hypothetical protein V6Z78_01320 [Holosporaceae bacterium]